jgi:hypothetical protein
LAGAVLMRTKPMAISNPYGAGKLSRTL